MEEEIMTIEGVAQVLHQDPSVIRDLMEKGHIPGRKIGDAWYVTRRQLVAFIEEGATSVPEKLRDGTVAADRPLVGRADNSWTCYACHAENNAERARCARCSAPRLTPLINYHRR